MNKYKVSYFETVKNTTPKDISLDAWLRSTMHPPKKLRKIVKLYRDTENKKHKEKIPCVTISATFKDVRKLDNINNKNNLICLDIDPKDNPVIDLNAAKELFKSHPSTLYCGRSVSNKGLYVIMLLNKKIKLKKAFKYFQETLLKKGIIIDNSCKDYTRLRFFSIDKKAYYNTEAKPLNIVKKTKITPRKSNQPIRKNDLEKVQTITNLIEQHQIDITTEYSDWIKIAGALYNAFGETGRDYFHRISKLHPDYKHKKADKKFNQCMKMNRVSLGALFYISDSYGIRY